MRAVTKFVVAILGAGLLAAAGAAVACTKGCPPPQPPSPPHNPKPPVTPCHGGGGCGGGGHHGGGGGNVNVNVTVKNSATASAGSFGSASAGAYYGGGYGNWSQSQGIPQSVGGLNVVTGAEGGGFEAYQEESTFTAMMILQASCIDDTGVPHPASQVFGDRDVRQEYSGEIYRCIAGTHMQVLMARCGPLGGGFGGQSDASYSESSTYRRSESSSSYESGYDSENGSYGQGGGYAQSSRGGSSSGGSTFGGSAQSGYIGGASGCSGMDFSHINFDGAQTLTCAKNQALWFDHGALTCRVQTPQRQCNERSLLRRFGAGIKVLTVTRTEMVTKRRETARSASYGSTSYMTFDGGVGGFVQ